MGFLDKLLGRGKKAAGDVTGDASMRREGAVSRMQPNFYEGPPADGPPAVM